MDRVRGRCGACASFRNDPAYLEGAMPGLSSLSSGAASVRADDGLCLRHERFLSARATCAEFRPAYQQPVSDERLTASTALAPGKM